MIQLEWAPAYGQVLDRQVRAALYKDRKVHSILLSYLRVRFPPRRGGGRCGHGTGLKALKRALCYTIHHMQLSIIGAIGTLYSFRSLMQAFIFLRCFCEGLSVTIADETRFDDNAGLLATMCMTLQVAWQVKYESG